jgi:NIMA (never in mitosis gene a)-related kinase
LDIIHRDIKGANIVLNKNKTIAKVADLNVSKVAKNKFLTTQTGTPYYASPEVWNDQPYNAKSDIWSLGCLIYELCALHPPFRGKDMEALYQKVKR